MEGIELFSIGEMFEKLGEVTPLGWVAFGVLIAFGIALLVLAPKQKWNARMLSTAALCLAASFVLSYIRLFRMPQGGSITLMSMLPVMLFSYIFGVVPGLLTGLAYGLLQTIQGAEFYSVMQFALDYFIAFGVLGLSGVTTKLPGKDSWKFPVGAAIAGLARTFCSFLSGFIFFGQYAPEGQSPVVYSLVYNLSSIGVDTLICVIGAYAISASGLVTRLKK